MFMVFIYGLILSFNLIIEVDLRLIFKVIFKLGFNGKFKVQFQWKILLVNVLSLTIKFMD